MIDVSNKSNSLRYARATGSLTAKSQTIKLVKNRQIPKGDVIEVARAAGINGAKRTAEWVIFCHPIPLDWIGINFSIGEDTITVTAEIKSVWKTGVEMEALTAVQCALINIYDMLKPLDNSLRITDIHLEEKRGGKSDLHLEPPVSLRAAIVVISDSAYEGKREDKSGKELGRLLSQNGIKTEKTIVIPDDRETIKGTLISLSDTDKVDLILTTGGTGIGPRDVTPEATLEVIDREIRGIEAQLHRYGHERTPFAMLSRAIAGVRKNTLIINLPGSSKGVKEGFEAIFPAVLHVFPMLRGEGHDK